MLLINTKSLPPGGWRMKQNAANGAFLKEFKSFEPWSMFLSSILEFRKANKLPRATVGEVDADVQDYMCREFGGDPQYCVVKKNTTTGQFQRVARGAARAVAGLRKLATGATILVDMFGGSKAPVAADLAQDRSDICTGRLSGNACPYNRPDADFNFITDPVSGFIKAQFEKLYEMKLEVQGQDNLQTCAICLCPLKLKVWTPIETILDRTPKAMLAKFKSEAPAQCWIVTETKNTPA